ncbi:DUF1446-domain-containing protein [Zopfia rhizophila CBS 207.26]|uniref:DUF1446-domain-containing protein n=1 Tax=Zopfia rhizophila CBS 207.26 TaxID=1314779 RepID=A0A6A6DC08_9PEZI|nr:DUF1446-domain-containing protein [Zopfia rhizophila CBS 207.26]
MPSKHAIRIGNVSGATGDAPHAMSRMAKTGNVDVITGDWLSEMNIAWNAIAKQENPEVGYEVGFLQQLEERIDEIAAQKIKVVTNAGALNTAALSRKVEELCQRRGYGYLLVAAVLGDDVTDLVKKPKRKEIRFPHLDHEGVFLTDWDPSLVPSCAAAYIGAWGVVEALKAGADIVICGRVTDASPVVGAAAWWYGWSQTSYDELAGALIAGHLIECGPYATGANFSGFKDFLPELVDLGFPIAEILPSGQCYITKPEGAAGIVNRFNITAQLLYELQGALYLNPDVVADISRVSIENTRERDRVFVSGAVGHPPPPTTKVMIAAPGGYQAEATYYINGLDISEKEDMMKRQLNHVFKGNKFSKLSAELYGSPAANPRSQQAGTAMLRVFAQARKKEDIGTEKFKIPIYSLRMQSYPGYHMNLDFRTMDPKPFMEIFPATINLSAIDHRVVLKGKKISIQPSPLTAEYPKQRPSYETEHPVPLDSFGQTKNAPLGSIVHARSGDKANNSNVGFFVRHDDEYPWLQSFMTVDRLIALFGDDWKADECESRVERSEFPRVLAVHFRILDFLDGGIASSSRIDGLGKGIGEYLRSKEVDIPTKFLERAWI